MAIAQKLAGYTLGKADLLRRAMGKKKEILDKEYAGFAQGMKDHGYSRPRSRRCGTSCVLRLRLQLRALRRVRRRLLLDGLPKRTTWPSTAAVLSVATTRTRRPSISRSAGDGIRVLLDVNDSVRTAPVGVDIRFGLGGIRNVGPNVVDSIAACARRRGVLLLGLPAQGRRGGLQQEGHRVADHAGAFDSLGHSRKGLLLVHADAIDAVIARRLRRWGSSTLRLDGRVRVL
jgi:DNA polymerase-3 subunit alpha